MSAEPTPPAQGRPDPANDRSAPTDGPDQHAARRRFRLALPAFGQPPTGDRARRVLASAQYHDGAFHNPAHDPHPPKGGDLFREFRQRQPRRPTEPIPVLRPSPVTPGPGRAGVAGSDAGDRLHVIWLGHATALVEIEGRTVLLDPVWSKRCSPSRLIGPRRLHQVPLPLSGLPQLDAILISHDHYDHLDMATVRTLTRTQSAPFLVPLGVGAHLDRWGVPADRIIELDWNQGVTVAGLRLTATAAQHFSGRGLARNRTLWVSWVIAGSRRRVFYTGDSGYFPGYADIGAEYGPFDLTLVQIGAYSPSWPDIHMTPEEALAAHLDVRGELFIPVHWATFVLAFHAWAEPVDRLWRVAKARDMRIAVPRPGERVNVDDPPPVDGWWQALCTAPARTRPVRLEEEIT
jgi:L-ascorbate metabolism protein UlaG (beta-lactamase superfamily)